MKDTSLYIIRFSIDLYLNVASISMSKKQTPSKNNKYHSSKIGVQIPHAPHVYRMFNLVWVYVFFVLNLRDLF